MYWTFAIIGIALFWILGFACAGWSRFSKNPDYAHAKFHMHDFWISMFGLAFAGFFDHFIMGHLIHGLHSIPELVRASHRTFSAWNDPAKLAAFYLCADFCNYWTHRLQHMRIVWPFHAYHHSSKDLNFLSGMRGSPVHYLMTSLPNATFVYLILIGFGIEAAIIKLIIDTSVQHYTHSNMYVPGAKYIEWLFVTPRMHLIHHHPTIKYTDSNYGVVFSIWDRLFGTYQDAEALPEHERGKTGLDYEHGFWSLFTGLPLSPRIYPEKDHQGEAPRQTA